MKALACSKYPSQENSDFRNTNLKWAFCVKLVAKATRKGLVFQEIWKTLRVEGSNKYMGRFKINEGRKLKI